MPSDERGRQLECAASAVKYWPGRSVVILPGEWNRRDRAFRSRRAEITIAVDCNVGVTRDFLAASILRIEAKRIPA